MSDTTPISAVVGCSGRGCTSNRSSSLGDAVGGARVAGRTGFVVLERMRNLANLAAIPVIVLSAWDPVDNRKRSLDAGAVALFQKPPENYEFVTSIRASLRRNDRTFELPEDLN
jgi:DNA-binding response OmpR family regulator